MQLCEHQAIPRIMLLAVSNKRLFPFPGRLRDTKYVFGPASDNNSRILPELCSHFDPAAT